MSSTRWILLVVGMLLLLAGIVFALQGANILGGSSLMSGDPTYIYVGAVVALVGLILAVIGARMGHPSSQPTSPGN